MREAPLPVDLGIPTGRLFKNNKGEVMKKGELAAAFGVYARMLENLDSLFARILNVTGWPSPTSVVCVASDHGEMMGDGFKWGKTYDADGSVRVRL